MAPLTRDEAALYYSQKKCYICQKAFCYDKKQEKRFKLSKKLEIFVILQENVEELLIAFVIYAINYPKKFL